MVCCFAAPRQVRSIQRSVSRPVLLSLDTSFELSRLDYGSATLASIPKYLLDRLQSILNAAARLIYRARKYDHVSPLLQQLHLFLFLNTSNIGWPYWCFVAGMTWFQSSLHGKRPSVGH